jgi:hypothetical protein
MELYVLEGPTERINAFADMLRGTRDALQVTMTFADAWKDSEALVEPHDHSPTSRATETKPRRKRAS